MIQDETKMLYMPVPTDLKTAIQDHDFASSDFDNPIPHNREIKNLYILISTPRSGSTALCTEIYKQTGLVIHEYLQPFQYMPYLASRYGAIEKPAHTRSNPKHEIIVLSKYFEELVRHRAVDGTLGINCHASHLGYLNALIEQAKSLNPNLEVRKDYLHRLDIYKQAASYAIAKQTRQWSTVRPVKSTSAGRLKRLYICINAARCYQKLKIENDSIAPPNSGFKYDQILTYETNIEINLEETAAQIVAALCLTNKAQAPATASSLCRQRSSLNDEVAKSIRDNMLLYRALHTIKRPLYKVLAYSNRLFRRLVHQHEVAKSITLLQINNKEGYALDQKSKQVFQP